MNQVTVSAPGKLVLFGEHAVVYGKPCIVTSVNQRMYLKAQKLSEPIFILNAPDVSIKNYKKSLKDVGIGELPKGATFVEIALKNFIEHHPIDTSGVYISTYSDFKSTFGFGSSSASTVCTIFALSKLFDVKLSNKQIFDLSYKTVLDIQGVGSGFDIAAATYGGTLFFVKGGQMIEQLSISNYKLVVGYTGIKADTPTIVKEIQAKRDKDPKFIDNIFNHIEQIVIQAKEALLKNDLEKFGSLMDENQTYLENLRVSSKILERLIKAARKAGAYGVKLSGAGGGDCMIALAPLSKKRAVEDAIEKAGGQVIKVEVNAEGVKTEN